MAKINQTKTIENKKTGTFQMLITALAIVLVLSSMSYTAFITAVGVGGKTNLYLALPSIIAVAGTIIVAVYKTVETSNK